MTAPHDAAAPAAPTSPPPVRAARRGERLALAAQVGSLMPLALAVLAAAGVALPLGGRALGSIALLLVLPVFAAAALLAARRESGARHWLFLGMGLSAVCSTAAQLHSVVRYVLLGHEPVFPSPGLLILLLGSHPLLLLALGGALGWRRERLRAEAAIDVLLLVVAAAIVGLQIGHLSPWPIGDYSSPAQLLLMR